jgi:hypothetical protein
MLWASFRFGNRRPAPQGRGFQYDATWDDDARGTLGEHLTTILPHYEDDKRYWIVFGHISWGKFETREQCARMYLQRAVLDPQTEALTQQHPLRTQYDIPEITTQVAEEIFAVLMAEAGAMDKRWEKETFVRELTGSRDGEYKFGGWISHGKIWWDWHSVWVGGANELMCSMQRNMVARTNAAIQGLLARHFPTL